MELDQSNLLDEGGGAGSGNYFAEIRSFRASPTPLRHIETIVGVRGDNRRGQKPFPHPFPARMPMEVAQAAIEGLTKPGDVVLDPMSGSGVVPRAASILGRGAIGIDIDPLAVIQGRALCAACDGNILATAADAMIKEATSLIGSELIEATWDDLEDEDRKFVDYWFEREYAYELFALSHALDGYADTPLFPILATIVSSLIISRGSGASRAMDLSRSRPHRVDSKVARSPFAQWHVKVDAFIRHYAANKGGRATDLRIGDARDLRIPDASIDAVITSPPYVNAIDYIRTSKFTLIFLGSRLRDLRAIRAASIGSEVGLAAGNLPQKLEAMVEANVSDPSRRPMLRRYVRDLRDALAEGYRVLKPGGHALYVMGPSILSRRDYDAADVLATIADSVGFQNVSHGRRNLDMARRSLPPPRRSNRAESINKRMTCEYYVVLAKDPD